MAETLYVRQTMLAPEEAPASQVGLIRWLRENLFSTWLNAILTLVAAYIVYALLTHLWPWFAHAVWNASSLSECRQIITETWGEGATGACFAVIRERWQQFLFGFYPKPLYWRPTLAFFLMLLALAPVLYTAVPRKLLWFSIAFPGIAFWLLWGGSLMLPIAVLPVAALIWNLMIEELSPALSAFWATMFLIFILVTQRPLSAWFRGKKSVGEEVAEGFRDLKTGLVAGSRNMIGVAIATSTAGIIVGTVTLTGIGLVLADVVEMMSAGNLFMMLCWVAIASLILGMGVPTTANYIVVSSLMAPVVVELGAQSGLIVPLIAVHMFVFYFGIMADVTPRSASPRTLPPGLPRLIRWSPALLRSGTASAPACCRSCSSTTRSCC